MASPVSPGIIRLEATPSPFTLSLRHAALLMIDMQRDVLQSYEDEHDANADASALQASINLSQALLRACRKVGLHILHTRLGSAPNSRQFPAPQMHSEETPASIAIASNLNGDSQSSHDFVDGLQPSPGEVVVDKTGHGAFWNTNLLHALKARAITHLIISGADRGRCRSLKPVC